LPFITKRISLHDIPLLLPLREEAEIFVSPIRDISADDVKKFILSRYQDACNVSDEEKEKAKETMQLFAVTDMEDRIVGFIALVTDSIEGITQEKQIEIYDLVIKKDVDQGEVLRLFLEEAEKICREKNIKYLVYTIQSGEKEKLELLQHHGFATQVNCIAKNLKRIKKWRTPKPWLRIRWAKISDLIFLLSLNNVASVNYALPHHDVPMSDVQGSFFSAYSENLLKWIMNEPTFSILIAEDVEKKESIGYVMLWLGSVDGFTGEKFAYIYDIAVKQEYWGKYVTHYLMEAAEKFVIKKGLDYIAGDISESNQRALRTAIDSIKFFLERYRLVKKFF
jgi:N-acetylglutamate synthase-like GNAT family acetyltransferase